MSFEQYTIPARPRDDWEITTMKGGLMSIREVDTIGGIVLESESEYTAFLRALRREAKKVGWEE